MVYVFNCISNNYIAASGEQKPAEPKKRAETTARIYPFGFSVIRFSVLDNQYVGDDLRHTSDTF
jgi:hypothetical protein